MNQEKRVVVTGIGIVAGNGTGKEEYMMNCKAGKSGIKKCTLFDTSKLRTPYFGQVNQELVKEISNPEETDRMEQLIELALTEMMEDGKISKEEIESYGTRGYLCFGTLLSTTDKILMYAKKEKQEEKKNKWLEHTVDYLCWMKEKSGIKGASYISGAACAAGTTAAGMAFDAIKNGYCDLAIVGGTDPLTEVAAFGFHALQSLSTGICNPFDENRDGINIGEGSAFLLFETLEGAKKRNAAIYGEILGYGLNNDAYHITSPDPQGAGACASMKMALQEGGIQPEEVSYVNAHGTGTSINDKMEIQAINQVFQNKKEGLAVNSTKALIGHCMGASGAVELATMLLCMREGVYLPMPNLQVPLEEQGKCILLDKKEPLQIVYGISNSFAFAGNTASILSGAFTEEGE
ncbi:MAG: beta-ketoacyl-[acyl-carrier-protein] synthase family protein [Lachnospiraceae bacterium]